MQLITALIPEDQLAALDTALHRFGITATTVCTVLSPCPTRHWQIYRGQHLPIDRTEITRLEILASDLDVDDIVRVVTHAAGVGDGWLWVTPLRHLVRLGPAPEPPDPPGPGRGARSPHPP